MAASKRRVAIREPATFRPYWLHVAGIVGLTLIDAGLGVVNPILIRSIFDDCEREHSEYRRP